MCKRRRCSLRTGRLNLVHRFVLGNCRQNTTLSPPLQSVGADENCSPGGCTQGVGGDDTMSLTAALQRVGANNIGLTHAHALPSRQQRVGSQMHPVQKCLCNWNAQELFPFCGCVLGCWQMHKSNEPSLMSAWWEGDSKRIWGKEGV